MNEMVAFLAKHGYWLLFICVLGRQVCLPVPTNMLLLAAGALAGLGRMSFVNIVAFSVIAFLLADLAWYEAGRRWGSRMLHFICGFSRDPSSRVRQVTERFKRHGAKVLLISKFIIGWDTVAAPMAGISGIALPRFLAFDAIGAILWSSAYAALGYAFRNQLDRIANYSAKMGTLVVLAAIAGFGVFIILRLIRLYRFLHEFRLARITPDQLMNKLRAGENILILDLQGSEKQALGVMAIPGAIRINPHQLERYEKYRNADLATNREVVLYCSCPSEFTSARIALTLRRRGFVDVRPLDGGLQAWRKRRFPVTPDVEMLPPPEQTVFVLREIFQHSQTSAAQLLKTSIANVDHLYKTAKQRTEKRPC